MTPSPFWTSRASWGPGQPKKLLREEGPQGTAPTPLECPVESSPLRTPSGQLLLLGHEPAERKGALGSSRHHGWSLWPQQASPLAPLPSLSPRGAVLVSPELDARQALSEWPLVFRFRPSPLMFPPVQARGGARVSRMPPGAKKRMSRKGDRARVVGTHRAPGEGGPRPGKRASWPACARLQAPPAEVTGSDAQTHLLGTPPHYGRSGRSAEGTAPQDVGRRRGRPVLNSREGTKNTHKHSVHTLLFSVTQGRNMK